MGEHNIASAQRYSLGLPRCARNDRKKIGNNKEGMSLRGAESDVAISVGWQNGDCHIPLFGVQCIFSR